MDRALMLAAGAGHRLSSVTGGRPKVLLELGGKTLLQRHLEHLTALGVPELVLVVGYRQILIREEVRRHPGMLPVRFVENPRFEEGPILSLWSARSILRGSVLFMDGDLLYPRRLLASVVRAPESTCFLVDPRPLEPDGEEIKLLSVNRRALALERKWPEGTGQVGEWVGVAKFGRGASEPLAIALDGFVRSGQTGVDYEEAMNAILRDADAGVVEVSGMPWAEIDFPEDLERAARLLPLIEALDRDWSA